MRISLPSFAAGAACAVVLAAVPTYAAITATDPHPTVFDGSTPLLTVQPPQFVIGQSISAATDFCGFGEAMYNFGIPLRLRWDATDAGSGAASFDVTRFHDYSGSIGLDLDHSAATTMDIPGSNYDTACGGGAGNLFRWITARDHRGNTATSSMLSDRVDVWTETGHQPVLDAGVGVPDLRATRTGTWATSSCTCHNGGTTTYTNVKGASITYTIPIDTPGQTVAIVAPTSSTRGIMNISVDGGTVQAVNTYATTTVNRVIVWQQSLGSGTHTIKITNAGTTGHGRIDVDSIMRSAAWTGEAPQLADYVEYLGAPIGSPAE